MVTSIIKRNHVIGPATLSNVDIWQSIPISEVRCGLPIFSEHKTTEFSRPTAGWLVELFTQDQLCKRTQLKFMTCSKDLIRPKNTNTCLKNYRMECIGIFSPQYIRITPVSILEKITLLILGLICKLSEQKSFNSVVL